MNFSDIVSLFEESEVMMLVACLFIFNLSIIFLDIVFDVIQKNQRNWKDTYANITIFIANQLLEKTLLGSIGIVLLTSISWATPFDIPMNIGTWIIAFFVADFTYYWMHRFEHKYRILWASHSVHHSSEDYNLTVSMRLSVVEGTFEWVFLIPMVLIGFSPFQAIVGLILVAQFQTWIHTERIGRLGFLDKLINTPSVHRVHHGSNNQYLDKNFGGFLIIWDRVFGTYQAEEEKVIYGLTKNINTNNPVKINFIEYYHICKELKASSNWRDKLNIIFGKI